MAQTEKFAASAKQWRSGLAQHGRGRGEAPGRGRQWLDLARTTRGRRGTSTVSSWWRRPTSGSGSRSPGPTWTAPCSAAWSSAMFGEEQGFDLTNEGCGAAATRWGGGVATAPVRRGSARDVEAPRARLIRRRRCLGAEEKGEVAAPWGMGQGRARLLLYRGTG